MSTSQLNPAPHPAPAFAAEGSHAPGPSFLRRNLGLIALVSLIVAAWMLVYTFAMFHPKYGAKATVIIKDSAITNRYVEPEQFYAIQTTTSTSSNPVLNTMGLLKSEAISDALWTYFSEKHPQELKRLKIKTQKDWESYYQDGAAFIKAKNQPGTDLIAIQFSWAEPKIAQGALTVVVKAFQDASRDLNKEEQISRTRFLSRQMGEIEAKLQDIRTQKSEYESRNATVSMKREGDDLAGSRMELSNKLAQLQGQAQGKENLVRRYQQMLGMSPEKALRGAALGQNSTMVKLQDELYRLQQQHSLLSSSLTDANPKVREVQAQIEQVMANIELEKDRIGEHNEGGEVVADSTRATLIGDMLKAQGEAQDLRAQAARIAQRLGQVNADIRNFPSTAVGLANLVQQENTLSTALDHLRQKVMEGKMKEAQTLSNVFIVDPPRLPEHPSFPSRTHLMVISILMAVAAGVSVAFIKEQLFAKAPLNPVYPAFDAQTQEFEQEFAPESTPGIPAEQRFGALETHPQPATAAAYVPQPQAPAQPVAQPAQAAGQAMPPAVKNAPNPDDVLGVNPPVEKVEMPVSGSLFDSLLPIAGPMARVTTQAAHTVPVQARNSQPDDFRRDLTQPLPVAASAHSTPTPSIANQPAGNAPQATTGDTLNNLATSNPQTYRDEDLLPPDGAHAAHLQQVRMASQRLADAINPAQGVPVLHAAPSATPAYINDPLSVASPANTAGHPGNSPTPENEAAIDEFPTLVLNETPAAAPVEVQSGPVSTSPASPSRPEEFPPGQPQYNDIAEDPATALYEAQAKAMPLPRRRRGRSVPAFLLDDRLIDVQADLHDEKEPAPYELVPRKQREQGMPAVQAETAPGFGNNSRNSAQQSDGAYKANAPNVADEAMFADLTPVHYAPSANLTSSEFPPMPDFVPKEFAKRRPKRLFGGLFSSTRKYRQPELVLGGHLHPRNR